MGDTAASDDAFMPRVETLSPAGAPPSDVVVIQTWHGSVIALNAVTGKPLWRWQTHDQWASAATAGECVFISSATSDRPVWVEMDAQPGLQWSAGALWNPLERTPRVQIRPSALTALRVRDGATLWRVMLYSLHAVRPVYTAGDAVITSIASFQSLAHEVIALEAATGAMRWSRAIGPLVTSTGFFARSRLLWVADGRIAVVMEMKANDGESEKTSFALLDAATGDVAWRGAEAPAEPAARGGDAVDALAYTLETRSAWPHTFVRAARSDGGDEVWRVAVEDAAGWTSAATRPLVRAGVVYLLASDRRNIRVRALNSATGRALWRWRYPTGLYLLFLARQASMRVQQAVRTGKWRPLASDLWRLRWLHPVRPTGAPAMDAAHGRLYIATPLGAFAVRAQDGRTLWHALPFVEISHVHVSTDEAREARR